MACSTHVSYHPAGNCNAQEEEEEQPQQEEEEEGEEGEGESGEVRELVWGDLSSLWLAGVTPRQSAKAKSIPYSSSPHSSPARPD